MRRTYRGVQETTGGTPTGTRSITPRSSGGTRPENTGLRKRQLRSALVYEANGRSPRIGLEKLTKLTDLTELMGQTEQEEQTQPMELTEQTEQRDERNGGRWSG